MLKKKIYLRNQIRYNFFFVNSKWKMKKITNDFDSFKLNLDLKLLKLLDIIFNFLIK